VPARRISLVLMFLQMQRGILRPSAALGTQNSRVGFFSSLPDDAILSGKAGIFDRPPSLRALRMPEQSVEFRAEENCPHKQNPRPWWDWGLEKEC